VDDAQRTLPSLRASFSTRIKRSLADNPFNVVKASSIGAPYASSITDPQRNSGIAIIKIETVLMNIEVFTRPDCLLLGTRLSR
jgi:hypothetical protein